MAITGRYGYNIVTGVGVSGQSIILALNTVSGVYDYDSLNDALNNSIGDEIYIKLLSDITLDKVLTMDSGKKVTINLNSYTLTLPRIDDNYGVIVKNGTLIIEGDGNVVVPGRLGFGTPSTTTTGHIVINGGTYVGESTEYLFGCYNGSITINGGSFKALYCILNNFIEDPSHNLMTGVATVNGGSFEVTDTDDYFRPFIFLGDVKVTGEADYRVHTAENLAIALKNGGTVTLTGDFAIDDMALDVYMPYYLGINTIGVPAGKTVVLDLNGHTISQTKECTSSYAVISNNGNLTINDSVGTGKITFKDTGITDPSNSWSSYVIRNDGTLIINGGAFEHFGEQTNNAHSAVFQYAGNTTINGGIFTVPHSRSVRIWNGILNISGGTFNGQIWLHAAMKNPNMTLNISGGSFSPSGGDKSSVFINNVSGTYDVSITGGTFNTKIGVDKPELLTGAITGGTFTDVAISNTYSGLFNEAYELVANEDGTSTLVPKQAE